MAHCNSCKLFAGIRNMLLEKIKRHDLLVIFIFIICYATIFSCYTVFKHIYFRTHCYDLGIFDQIFWNIVHHGTEINTIEVKPMINHLGVHFSLIFYLVAPLYAIFQTPKTLLVLQSFLLGFGALPLYLLAKKKTNSIFFAYAISISYLLYPALHYVNLYDFHEVAFAPILLLFTLYFLEIGKYRWFLVFLLLSFFVKEDVALSGAFIGFYILFVKKEKALGIGVILASVIYFLLTIKIFMPFFGQVHDFSGRYKDLLYKNHEGYVGIFYNAITHPLFVFQYVFLNLKKLRYIYLLMYPVIFLPFFSGTALLLIIPSLFVNLLSSYPVQYGILMQYTAIIIPFVFFTAVEGYRKLPLRLKKYQNLFCYALISVTVVMAIVNIGKDIHNHKLFIEINYPEHDALIQTMKLVPNEASISTISNIVPHLTQRKEIRQFPNVDAFEYVLLDLSKDANYWPADREGGIKLLKKLLQDKKYGVVSFEESSILLRKGYDTSQNDNALVRIDEFVAAGK